MSAAQRLHAVLREVGGASAAAVARLVSSPEALAKQAFLSGADAVVELVQRQAERLALLVDERDRLAAECRRLTAALGQDRAERDELATTRAERDRLAAELRARRSARAELPRTSGELRAWRQVRALTQVQAAERLGVGSATVERAEMKPPEAPLGRALRLAFERDAEATRETTRAAAPTPPLGVTKKSARRERTTRRARQ